jgi:HSP90 family molecular chaperone
MQHIKEYLNKPFINVVKDDLKIDNETVNDENTNNEICKRIKDVLGDLVNNVSISTKIVNQPGIISSPMGISAGMERIMKTQSVNDEMLSYMIGKKILEINPTHKIIQKIIETNYDKNYVFAVFEMACLAGGYQLDNINGFLTRIYELI